MAAIFSTGNSDYAMEQCKTILSKNFNMKTSEIEKCLTQIPKQVDEVASALGLHIKKQIDFEQILYKTSVRLAEENLNYQDLTWRLEQAIKERDLLSKELNKEINLAKEIQQSMLPQSAMPDSLFTGINISAKELSGDFFDYFTLKDGQIYFNLGDVSGKGINAALLMSKVSSLFRCLGKQILDPGILLATINDEMYETSIRGMFVTIIAGLYNPATRHLQIVNAGHPPGILLTKNGKGKVFSSKAPPLGVVPHITFPAMDMKLSEASVYFYSDGVIERQMNEGEQLGVNGLLKMIAKFSHNPPEQRLKKITSLLQKSKFQIADDMTILLLEEKG